jgi:hypothetical protein
MSRSWENFLFWMQHSVVLDTGDYRKTVFIAGVGRSGTTWLAETINFDGSYRVMFEPFHPKRNPMLRGWHDAQYIRPSDSSRRKLDAASRILSGNIHTKWVNRLNRRKFATQRLIKEVRANLLLKWLKTNFPEMPLVFILRHPCAVAASKMQTAREHGFEWVNSLDVYLRQADLMEDHLSSFRSAMMQVEDPFEKFIHIWCIENYVPMKQLEADQVHILFYEDLCAAPEPTLTAVMGYLKRPISSGMFQAVLKPSALTRPHSAILTDQDLIYPWRKTVSMEQSRLARNILAVYGLQNLYGADDLPALTGAEALDLPKKHSLSAKL